METISWEDYCTHSPSYSVALDGYVNVGPRYNPKGHQVNFNHHEEVDRLATRSTCAQVLMAIRQGLFPIRWVDVQDCDEDVCTAVTLLRHRHLVAGTMNPLVNRLVAMEDALDCTAGAYPFPIDLPILEELAWVFQPYRNFRATGQLEKKNAAAYAGIITDVENRILRHVTGKGESIPLQVKYDPIGGGPGWTMVREIGAQARTAMFADGIRAFVSVRERADGRWAYVAGKMSPFIPLDLLGLAEDLNEEEARLVEGGDLKGDTHGGGNTVIGSPRGRGSAIPPDRYTTFVNARMSV